MAKLIECFSEEMERFRRDYVLLHKKADENRQTENRAAIRIQSWFRGCKARAYLSHLHKKAIIIQKIWRGFTARARFRQMVKAAYFIMKMNFYAEMAIRIQRRWRGFYVRKYIHNFYARKRDLERICRTNEFVRMELNELQEFHRRQRDCVELLKQQTAKIYRAHRLHHLLSTKQQPGIFNSPFRPAPHETELLLRQVKYRPACRLPPRGGNCPLGIPGRTALSSPESLRAYSWPLLPPIASKALQSVQREPGEVWEQRVRSPDLMRLQKSYTHLEEAKRQLQYHNSKLMEQYTDIQSQN